MDESRFPAYPSKADVDEMRFFGDDPALIEAAQTIVSLRPRAIEICRLIESAFANVTLGDGIGLKEARGLDDYDGPEVRAAYRAGDEKDDWRRIPASGLNECYSSLSFFDAAGMRFHLPAFLIAELTGEYKFGLTELFADVDDYRMSQLALLSASQHDAVRALLLHMLDHPDHDQYRGEVQQALDTYWVERGA